MDMMTLTVRLTGNPLNGKDRFQVRVWVGDVGTEKHKPASDTRLLLPSTDSFTGIPDAVRCFHFPIPEEWRAAFPEIVFDGMDVQDSQMQEVFEGFMALCVTAGLEMLPEWVANNTIAVREQAINRFTCGKAPLSSLL